VKRDVGISKKKGQIAQKNDDEIDRKKEVIT